MKRRFHFTTRGWFQLTMMPALILVSAVLGWSVYRSLQGIILRSFEQKLGAVSTTVAAFIDADDHAWLMEQPRISGLAFSPQGYLFALDSSRDVLMRINAANGVAEDRVVKVPAGLRDLAYSRAEDLLAALELPSGKLYTLDPETGTATYRLDLGEKAQGIVAGPNGYVVAVTDRLLEVKLAAGAATPMNDAPMPRLLGAGYDADHKVIRAISASRRFIAIDPFTGKIKVGAALDEKAELPGDLAYDRQRHLLLGSNKSILHVDYENGTIAPAHYLPAFGKELSPQYRAYLGPMRQIMNDLQLTYLYTQIVPEKTRIIYGIDATQGDGHSALHSEDTIPEEEVEGVQELLRSGALYHSPVTKWQQWGLLKGSLAPIFDRTGKVVAMAGADVEVSLIEQKTREALLELLIVGVLSVLAATGVAIVITRHLRRPLQQIKTTALDVAAGNYARRITIDSPTEARELAESFNQMAGSLEANMQALQSSIQDLLRNRNRYELGRRLGGPHDLAAALGGLEGVTVAWRDSAVAALCATGAVRHGGRIVIWFAESPSDGLTAARARADLALRVTARLKAVGDDDTAVPVPGQTAAPFAFAAGRTGAPPRAALPAGVRAVALVFAATRTVRVLQPEGIAIDESVPGRIRLAAPEVTIEFRDFALQA
ncbi:MAG TPA: HAMP domain-containing protein [Opitutaceae bacterium]|nr:HAMP domain-containing protein [Opitutaceae bacterium]